MSRIKAALSHEEGVSDAGIDGYPQEFAEEARIGIQAHFERCQPAAGGRGEITEHMATHEAYNAISRA